MRFVQSRCLDGKRGPSCSLKRSVRRSCTGTKRGSSWVYSISISSASNITHHYHSTADNWPSYILQLAIMIVTFSSHTLWFKKPLDASTVFSSIGVFEIFRNQLTMLFREIPLIIQAKVSLDRTDEFLNKVSNTRLYRIRGLISYHLYRQSCLIPTPRNMPRRLSSLTHPHRT